MCSPTCLSFVERHLAGADVSGARVLEVGAADVNGSARKAIEKHTPASYTGVDLAPGPGVDEVVDVGHLVQRFGPESFDVVLSTEMLEHVRNWRAAIRNLKSVVRVGGLLILTTRSVGFHYHGYPYDFWRFEPSDFEAIFADFDIRALETDDADPGVFLAARRRESTTPVELDDLSIYSIIRRRRVRRVSKVEILVFRVAHVTRLRLGAVAPEFLKRPIRRARTSAKSQSPHS